MYYVFLNALFSREYDFGETFVIRFYPTTTRQLRLGQLRLVNYDSANYDSVIYASSQQRLDQLRLDQLRLLSNTTPSITTRIFKE